MEKGSIRALARKVFAATRRSISPYDICLAYFFPLSRLQALFLNLEHPRIRGEKENKNF